MYLCLTRGNGRGRLRLELLPVFRLCTGPLNTHTFKPHRVPAKEVVSHFPCGRNRTSHFSGVTQAEVRGSDLHL